ncbi:endo-1,4-beta-xylanase [Paenibacillus cymbidii]|uniref:endo-1,4-beta-xylanase n=1 Tax=Paenibacillus cymbidii TaxID=1639034 RepID=UPI0014367475|nr:endo-1,4-beta-xylanase [Paenibacillus cymbidii]
MTRKKRKSGKLAFAACLGLTGAALWVSSGVHAAAPPAPNGTRLEALVEANYPDFDFGFMPTQFVINDDPEPSDYIRDIVELDTTMVALQNTMDSIANEDGTYNWTKPDQYRDYAQSIGKKMHQYHLVWTSAVPGWLNTYSPTDVNTRMKDFINAFMTHYNGDYSAYNVVNEAISDSGTAMYRDNFWWQKLGDVYVETAFREASAARAANGETDLKLYYNDFNTEKMGPKSDKMYNMAADFLSRGVPLDGIGFQLHVKGASVQSIGENMDRFGALGLEMKGTELDIPIDSATAVKNEADQAAAYKNLLDLFLDHPQSKGLLIWGVTDGRSWLGANSKPLLFDYGLYPKEAYYALQQRLAHEPDHAGVIEAEHLELKGSSDTVAVVDTGAASGGQLKRADLDEVDDYVSYKVYVNTPGTYPVKVTGLTGSNRGQYQLSINGTNVGTADLYSATSAAVETNLGNYTFGTKGTYTFTFKVTGKSASSTGYILSYDKFKLDGLATFEAEDVTADTSENNTTVFDTRASNGMYIRSNSNSAGDHVSYTIHVPTAGTYALQVTGITGADRGKYQLSVNGTNVGSEIDLYGTAWQTRVDSVGSYNFSAPGDYIVKLQVTGKHASSSGFALTFDSIKLNGFTSPAATGAPPLPTADVVGTIGDGWLTANVEQWDTIYPNVYAESGGTYAIDSSRVELGVRYQGFDAHAYVAKTLTGDGEIVAKVESLGGTGIGGRAALLMRESLYPQSKNAIVFTNSFLSDATFNTRTEDGDVLPKPTNVLTGIVAPYWLKLTRTGNTFAGYVSSDGVAWTQAGANQTVNVTSTVYMGMSVSAINQVGQGQFSNVELRQFTDDAQLTTLTYGHAGGGSGAWSHVTRNESYGKTISYSSTAGNYVRYAFNGKSVQAYVQKGAGAGQFDVYVDGAYETTIDGYNATALNQVKVFEKTWASSGPHTIELRNKGTKNAAATNYWLNMDYFKISK